MTLAALATAWRVLMTPGPVPRIILENAQSVQLDMNRKQVEAILGRPGDYRTEPTEKDLTVRIKGGEMLVSNRRGGNIDFWETDTLTVSVGFDSGDDRVNSVRCAPMKTRSVGRLEKFFWRLEQKWHNWLK
jgi:hypothetical protein